MIASVPLLLAWKGWRARVEVGCTRAAELDVVVRKVRGEQDKGSSLVLRRARSHPLRRPSGSIHLRCVRRLHNHALEHATCHCRDGVLSRRAIRSWSSLARDYAAGPKNRARSCRDCHHGSYSLATSGFYSCCCGLAPAIRFGGNEDHARWGTSVAWCSASANLFC